MENKKIQILSGLLTTIVILSFGFWIYAMSQRSLIALWIGVSVIGALSLFTLWCFAKMMYYFIYSSIMDYQTEKIRGKG